MMRILAFPDRVAGCFLTPTSGRRRRIQLLETPRMQLEADHFERLRKLHRGLTSFSSRLQITSLLE